MKQYILGFCTSHVTNDKQVNHISKLPSVLVKNLKDKGIGIMHISCSILNKVVTTTGVVGNMTSQRCAHTNP